MLLIWAYIARDNKQAADRFIDRLIETFQILGNNPQAVRRRDELRPGYRSFPIGDYLIFYRIADPGVRILHVGKAGFGELSVYAFLNLATAHRYGVNVTPTAFELPASLLTVIDTDCSSSSRLVVVAVVVVVVVVLVDVVAF
ncbi:MAG: type II toxin-antitoxin system RelE/ParE family toxin [Acidobacteriia bacterium]|nr:type II toxin-antitoxin system RelE/ParE family toxin [Terriglobia bacterium]